MKKFRRMTRSNQFKVVLLVIGAAFVIWLVSALTPEGTGVSINITVDCGNVGEIRCDFSLDGKELGTMYAGVEDNNALVPFERGEVVSMNIPARAFDNKARLRTEKFKFELYVLDASGESHRVRCENSEFFASLGGKYSYTLTRDNGEYRCA